MLVDENNKPIGKSVATGHKFPMFPRPGFYLLLAGAEAPIGPGESEADLLIEYGRQSQKAEDAGGSKPEALMVFCQIAGHLGIDPQTVDKPARDNRVGFKEVTHE